ncbi:MAG: hypothetical protein ABIP95_16340 [Pelobium sp.]
METPHQYTVEEVLEIVNTMDKKDQAVLKNKLLLEETAFENLVKEDFAKYEATFKALS